MNRNRKVVTLIKVLMVIFILGMVAAIVINEAKKARQTRLAAETATEVKTTLEGETEDGYPYVATLEAIRVSEKGYGHKITFKAKEADEETGEQATVVAFDFREIGEKTGDGIPSLYNYEGVPIGHPLNLSRGKIQVDYETLMIRVAAKQAMESVGTSTSPSISRSKKRRRQTNHRK